MLLYMYIMNVSDNLMTDQEMNIFFLYVVLLQNEKFLLHASLETDDQKIKNECEILYDFVKLHKPLSIFDKVKIDKDFSLIDLNVKKYMLQYGIEHVRGGSYSSTVLPSYLLKSLDNEFNTICNYDNEHITQLKDIFSENNEETIQNKLNDYITMKNNYHSYKYFQDEYGIKYEINRECIKELEWIINKIQSFKNISNDLCISIHKYAYIELNNEQKTKYTYIMKKITEIVKMFFKINKDDEYITEKWLNKKTVTDVNISKIHNLINKEYIDELIKNTEFFVYSVINRLDEIEFDLSTYPHNFESKYKNKIYFLQNRERL